MRLEKRGGRACESCALALERQVGRIAGVRRATASFNGGVMAVHYDRRLITFSDIARRVEQFGVGVGPAADLPSRPVGSRTRGRRRSVVGRARHWLTPQKLQAILTVVTFVTMMSAWLLERYAAAGPAWVVTALYVIAYVAGGAFGLKGGIESLMARTLDIDLLMILAALGAAFVGEPFEGAMLLFLFSLSNTLQDFALDRTRNAIRALMKLRPNRPSLPRRPAGDAAHRAGAHRRPDAGQARRPHRPRRHGARRQRQRRSGVADRRVGAGLQAEGRPLLRRDDQSGRQSGDRRHQAGQGLDHGPADSDGGRGAEPEGGDAALHRQV
jgi:hypothetical protein